MKDSAFPVISAEAGIQGYQEVVDPGFRRGDGWQDLSGDLPVLMQEKTICCVYSEQRKGIEAKNHRSD